MTLSPPRLEKENTGARLCNFRRSKDRRLQSTGGGHHSIDITAPKIDHDCHNTESDVLPMHPTRPRRLISFGRARVVVGRNEATLGFGSRQVDYRL